MIVASVYYSIYFLIVTILSLFVYSHYSHRNTNNVSINNPKRVNNVGLFLLVIFLTLFIGFRPQSYVFVDMMNYIQNYHAFFENVPFHWDANAENFLFDNYFAFVGSQNLGTTFFFVTIAAIYFGCAYWGIHRLFPMIQQSHTSHFLELSRRSVMERMELKLVQQLHCLF